MSTRSLPGQLSFLEQDAESGQQRADVVQTTQSPIKYHGGKGNHGGALARWIASHMPGPPDFTRYYEPFCGGCSV